MADCRADGAHSRWAPTCGSGGTGFGWECPFWWAPLKMEVTVGWRLPPLHGTPPPGREAWPTVGTSTLYRPGTRPEPGHSITAPPCPG